MRTAKIIIQSILLFLLAAAAQSAVLGNRFILAQLKVGEDPRQWDPYPLITTDVLSFLRQTTSVKAALERRVVSLTDPLLFETPFVIYSGSGILRLSRDEKQALKRYCAGGGFIFVEDRDGEKGGTFDYSFRQLIKELFPDKSLFILPKEHALYRSFYLLRTVSGRRMTNPYLEGLDIDGHTVLIYSQNDVLGAWAKDLFGNYIYKCSPGGESQRWEAQKLMMNLILYSVTGTYKTDSIHLPFIERKLRR